jgi:hypothetical protein
MRLRSGLLCSDRVLRRWLMFTQVTDFERNVRLSLVRRPTAFRCDSGQEREAQDKANE